MDFTGKTMRGFITVEPEGLEDEKGISPDGLDAGADFAASLPPK